MRPQRTAAQPTAAGRPAVPRAGLLVVFAMLVGACGVTAPVATPAATAVATLTPTPSPAPTPTPLPSPTVLPTAQPLPTCPADPGSFSAGMDLQAIAGPGSIDLQPGPLPPPMSVDASVVPIVATVLGGRGLVAVLHIDSSVDDTIAITTVAADFLPYGSASTLPVGTTIDGPAETFTLPDRSMNGQLRLAISWTTRCGSGQGAGTIGLTVVLSSVAAGCPTTGDGLLASMLTLNKQHMTVGTLIIPIGIVGWSGRWIPATAGDDIVRFSGWNRDVAVTAGAGTSILVGETISDLRILSIRAATFQRADVLAYLSPDSTGEVPSLSITTRPAGPKGHVAIPVPAVPGSYLIEMQGSMLTSCLSLQTYAAVSVTVQ